MELYPSRGICELINKEALYLLAKGNGEIMLIVIFQK